MEKNKMKDFDFYFMAKVVPRKYFKDASILPSGFAVDCLTIQFDRKTNTMALWDFDPDTGKCNEGTFFVPDGIYPFINKLIYHCGKDHIARIVKNNISIV